ncbi:YidB family protein, partial [Methylobacterium trifolii]
DIGGFNQRGGRRDVPETGPGAGALPDGDYSDLSGMLDEPGDRPSQGRRPDAGPYAHLDREAQDGADLGGLDGLIDRFRQGGLGDAIESWIGHGQNRTVEPDQLARALGPGALDTLQNRTGLGRDALLSQLAEVLPQVIDGLTPHGRVPEVDERRHW